MVSGHQYARLLTTILLESVVVPLCDLGVLFVLLKYVPFLFILGIVDSGTGWSGGKIEGS